MAHSHHVFGSFGVRADLGQGRFGAIYRAEDSSSGEPVIVRTIEASLEPAQRRALADALQWLCETPLDHPAIGRPLACGIEEDTPYLAHAVVSGLPLDEFLDRRGPQPVDDTIVRLTQLAGAMDFAAAAGVHHGALDRRDVFLGAHHSALAGFGLAQVVSQAGLLIDTASPYASPQQQAGEPPTRADDVYALAVVALQLLCGRADAGDRPGDLIDVLHEAGLSPALREVFDLALSADPRERPDTALAFAAALQAAIGSAPAAAPEPAGMVAEAPVIDPFEDPGWAGADAAGDLPLGVAGDGPRLAPAPRAHETDIARTRSVPGRRARQTSDGDRRVPDASPGALTAVPAPDDRDRLHTPPADAELRSAQLPFDLSLADPAGDAVAQTPTVAPGGAPPLFAGRAESPSRRSWLVGGAVIAVLLLAGVGGIWLLDRSASSVPFPRSAAPLDRAPELGTGERVDTPPPDARTVIPDAPAMPGTRPIPDPITEPPGPAPAEPAPSGGAVAPAPQRDPIVAPPPQRDAARPVSPPEAAAAREAAPPPAAPPPAPPRPEPPPGRILVRSTPAGAQVQVDGEPRGTTPLAVRELPFGSHTITVTHPSYGSRQERVTLTPAVPARSVDFELDQPVASGPATPARAGALQVESRPAGAHVFLDNRLIGTTPLLVPDLPAGSHAIRLELPGYRQWSTSVTVASGQRARVAASLEP